MAAGAVGAVRCRCVPGERAITAGLQSDGDLLNIFDITESFPTTTSDVPTGWYLEARNTASASNQFLAFLCAQSREQRRQDSRYAVTSTRSLRECPVRRVVTGLGGNHSTERVTGRPARGFEAVRHPPAALCVGLCRGERAPLAADDRLQVDALLVDQVLLDDLPGEGERVAVAIAALVGLDRRRSLHAQVPARRSASALLFVDGK